MIDRIFSAAGALFFAQFPQVYLQYQHELNGHLAELKYQVSMIEHAASLSNKTLGEWVAKFQQSPDPDFSLQGQILGSMVERMHTFQDAMVALQNSSPFLKPVYFARYADSQVLKDTVDHFQFGISFSAESLGYAFFGLLAGYGVYRAFAKIGGLFKNPLFSFKP
jgi:hypothetical protein